MLPTIQIHNTLPLNLKINFQKGPNADTSIFIGRSSKINVSVHPDDIFDICWSRNSEFPFLEGIKSDSDQIDQDTRTLSIGEKYLKSFVSSPGIPRSFDLRFPEFDFYKFDKDGKLSTDPKNGTDAIAAIPGEVYKIVHTDDDDKEKGNPVGYFMVDPQMDSDDDYGNKYNAWINFSFSSFGSISDNEYSLVQSPGGAAFCLPNYNPGTFLAQNKGVHLNENQIVLYDQLGKVDSKSGGCTFPNGTQFIVIDKEMGDMDTVLKAVASYFGDDDDGFDLKMIEFGPNTAIDTYSDKNYKGDKSTIKPPDSSQWLKTEATFASFRFVEVESQVQAHMHVRCDLVEGLSHDSSADNPTHFRVNVRLARKKEDGKFPKIRFEVANQKDINSDFTSITVNGDSHDFDSDTNQTKYISPNAYGGVIATWNPSDKRTGTPQLYLHTEAMPAQSVVAVSPALTMHHRMSSMTNSTGAKAGEDFSKLVKDKSKISLTDKQAGKITDITQHLQRSVVHNYKHTQAGNQTHHVVDAKSFLKAYDAVVMDCTHAKNPTFTTHAAGSNGLAVALAQFEGATAVAPSMELSELIGLGDITHVVVAGGKYAYDKVKEAGEAGEKALHAIEKLENAVEDALVAIAKVGGKLVYYAVESVEEVAVIVTKIYDIIKMAILDVIDFFMFLFILFEDIKKVFDALKAELDKAYNTYFSDTAIKRIEKDADKIVDDAFDTINKWLDLSPPTYSKKDKKGHKASNPGGDTAKEKLNWLLHEILSELEGGSPGTGKEGPFGKFVNDFKKETKKDTLDFLFKTIKDFVEKPDDLHGAANDFVKNLKSELEDNLSGWQKSIKSNIKAVAKAVEKNPLDQGISQNLPPCFQSGVLGKLLTLTNLDGKFTAPGGVSPADAICLIYAVPTGITWALLTAFDSMEDASLKDKDTPVLELPIVMDTMAILGDIIGGVTSTINVEKGASGDAASLPDLVKEMFQGFGLADVVLKSLQLSKFGDDSPTTKAMKMISIARTIGGFVAAAAAAAKEGRDVPVAKVQCAMDVAVGVIGLNYALYEMANNPAKGKKQDPYLGYFAGLFESASKIMELAVVDEEPDSRTAAILLMDFSRAVGGTLRVADLVENK